MFAASSTWNIWTLTAAETHILQDTHRQLCVLYLDQMQENRTNRGEYLQTGLMPIFTRSKQTETFLNILGFPLAQGLIFWTTILCFLVINLSEQFIYICSEKTWKHKFSSHMSI